MSRIAQLVSDKKKPNRVAFFEEFKGELKRVSWTGKEELIQCTKVVVGATLAFGIGIYIVDLCLRGGINALNVLVRWIAG